MVRHTDTEMFVMREVYFHRSQKLEACHFLQGCLAKEQDLLGVRGIQGENVAKILYWGFPGKK